MSNTNMCISGCGMEESVNHFFGSLWYLVRQWLGFLSLNLLHVADHLIQLGNLERFANCSEFNSYHMVILLYFS